MHFPTRLGVLRSLLSRQVKLAAAHFSELLYQFACVLFGQLPREASQTLNPLLELLSGSMAVPIFFSSARKKLLPHPVQFGLHLPIADKVQLLELVDKPDQTIQRLLMDARFTGPHAFQHLFAELACLLTQRRHTIAEELLHVLMDAFAGVPCCLFASRDDRLLVCRLDQTQIEPFGRPDLVELHTEFEAPFCAGQLWERRLDVCQQPFGIADQPLRRCPLLSATPP